MTSPHSTLQDDQADSAGSRNAPIILDLDDLDGIPSSTTASPSSKSQNSVGRIPLQSLYLGLTLYDALAASCAQFDPETETLSIEVSLGRSIRLNLRRAVHSVQYTHSSDQMDPMIEIFTKEDVILGIDIVCSSELEGLKPGSSVRGHIVLILDPFDDQWQDGQPYDALVALFSQIFLDQAVQVATSLPLRNGIYSRETNAAYFSSVSSYWTEEARKAGAAAIEFINDVDDKLPFEEIQAFRYLERRYEQASRRTEDTQSKHKDCLCHEGSCVTNGCRCCQGQIFSSSGKVLNASRALVTECTEFCKCDPTRCRNRVCGSHRRHLPLTIFKTASKGWCVRCPEPIEKGTILGVFTGRLVRRDEAERYEDPTYLYDIDMLEEDEKMLFGQSPERMTVDSTDSGRFSLIFCCPCLLMVFHSCEPNVSQFLVRCDQFSQPYIAFFAHQDILPSTELTFSYNGDQERPMFEDCSCGAVACRALRNDFRVRPLSSHRRNPSTLMQGAATSTSRSVPLTTGSSSSTLKSPLLTFGAVETETEFPFRARNGEKETPLTLPDVQKLVKSESSGLQPLQNSTASSSSLKGKQRERRDTSSGDTSRIISSRTRGFVHMSCI
ncbi:hypothetical protein DL96DRAFT_1599868 [Flagelloscypha sp. PMI_526]|nr:hypothetical protein DL96DRAFT_1599868 [Flagelloscypha sp. PMI_526]